MDLAPRTTRAEVDAAVDRIVKRHLKFEDPHLGDVDLDKPADLLEYIHHQRSRQPAPPRSVLQHDVCDALVLHEWERWQTLRRERDLLRDGIELGMPLAQLGAPLGLGSRVRDPERGNRRQGVRDRLDRLEALLKYDTPDASITRAARRVDREAAERASAGEQDPQTAWLAAHRALISSVAAKLLAQEPLANEDAAELLVEVRHDWRDDAWTPGSLVWMGMAAQALRVSSFVDKAGTLRYVVDVDSRHAVHRAIRAVEDLRAAFASLS